MEICMKKLFTIICLLSISSTIYASCPKIDKLSDQKISIDSESNKLMLVADYLNSRIMEIGGEFQNSHDIGLLMNEVRTKSVSLRNQSAKLQLQISDAVLKCINSKG
jgi:hypothetical protein